MFDLWDDTDDAPPVAWEDIQPMSDDELMSLSEDVDYVLADDDEDVYELDMVTDAPWLHSFLYSDYADPSDDDDRVVIDIPRSVLDLMTGDVA